MKKNNQQMQNDNNVTYDKIFYAYSITYCILLLIITNNNYIYFQPFRHEKQLKINNILQISSFKIAVTFLNEMHFQEKEKGKYNCFQKMKIFSKPSASLNFHLHLHDLHGAEMYILCDSCFFSLKIAGRTKDDTSFYNQGWDHLP